MDNLFKKTWCEIRLPNKDIKILLSYAPNCTAHFTYCYNGISGGYMGLQIDTLISTLRGLLRAHPEFMETISEHQYRKAFTKMGFIETEPDERDVKIYTSISQIA